MKKVAEIIDSITLKLGQAMGILMLPLTAVLAYDIIIRRVDQATLWAFDVSLWLFSLLFLFGSAWVLKNKSHITIEFLYENFPERVRLIHYIVVMAVFLIPMCIVMIVSGLEDTLVAIARDQRSIYSPWRPILWPMKAMLPAGFTLILLQGISEIIKTVYELKEKPSNPESEGSGTA